MDRVTVITTKQDMSRFARSHEGSPVCWHTEAGPGGEIIIHEEVEDE